MHTTRRFAMALAFMTGAACGLVAAWLLDGRRPAGPGAVLRADDAGPGPVTGDRVPRADAGPSLQPQAPQPSVDTQPAPEPTADAPPRLDPALPPGVGGWIHVEVTPPPGRAAISGVAYALSAGSRGTDDEDLLPHAYIGSETPGRIPVPRPGAYDVGFAWDESHLLRTDVDVAPGETAHVAIRPPAASAVVFELVDPLPREEGLGDVRVNGSLARVPGPRAVSWPGRGEQRRSGWGGRVGESPSPIGRVVPGERVEVRAHVVGDTGDPKRGWRRLRSYVAVCVPSWAEGGDHVRVRILPAVEVTWRVTLDLDTWPVGGSAQVALEVEHPGGVERMRTSITRTPAWTEASDHTVTLLVPPGPFHIRSSGPRVASGSVRGTASAGGEPVVVETTLAYRGPAPPSGQPLRVQCEWPEGADGDASLELAGMPVGAAEGIEDLRTWSGDRSECREGDASGLRAARTVVATLGRSYASDPVPVPSGDVLEVRLVRGGLIVVTPSLLRPETLGRMMLRRSDGLPIREVDGFRAKVVVEAGSVLGPFPPGAYRFEVWLGAIRMPDASVTVRAGRAAPLVIR